MTTAKTLGRVWASSPKASVRDPGESKYALGWVAEIPTYQVLNYLHNRIDNNILALAERGVFQWGADVKYKKGALSWDETNGCIYVALVANPDTSLTPSNNTSQWAASSIQIPQSQFDKVQSDINNHITDLNNPHQLTAAQLNAYTMAQINQLIGNVQTELDAHKAANNPHHTNANDVNAVPITGGRYTGIVYHDANILGIGTDTTNAVQVSASKIFFKKGNLELGLDENGDPYFYDGTKQYLLNEELFVSLKQEEEVTYAIPNPDLVLNPLSDLNIYAGTGPTYFTSNGNIPYVNKEGVSKVSGVDEPRFTQYGLAMQDSNESFRVARTYDGKGFSDHTDALEVYVTSATDNVTVSMSADDGFLRKTFKLYNNTLTFTYYNGNSTIVAATVPLPAGRHILTATWKDSAKVITAYVDGVKIYSAGTAVPSKTDWNNTYLNACSVSRSNNTYYQRFRSWAVCLTDRQVSTL